MALSSGLAWLSSSSAEISRARSVLDALRKPGVIDELGFLMLSSAFAERLYPGVTTIMTRARYLIFVPAIYRYLEQSRKRVGRDVDALARDLQFELGKALSRNEDSYIGKESGRALVRTPAAIYWSALGTLGIATRRISEASYQRQLSEGAFGLRALKDDDHAVHDDEDESLWNKTLNLNHVMPGGAFPESTRFRLRKSEAGFLASRYEALKPDGQPTLVTLMIQRGRQYGARSLDDIELPWDIPGIPHAMSPMLEHAKRLSLLARGATLQYYKMLTERKQVEDSGVEEAFIEWWQKATHDLQAWNLEDFFSLMTHWGAGRGPKDRQFITSWIERCLAAKSGRQALADGTARALIAQRETQIRPGKQRLKVKDHLDSWKLPVGVTTGLYLMDYRHRVGKQIASDIVEGLEGGVP